MFRTRKPRKFSTWISLSADSRQKRFPSRWTMRNFASARWGFLLNFIGTTLRNSTALCPVRPPQTAIGRPAGTLLGSAPVPVAVSALAPAAVDFRPPNFNAKAQRRRDAKVLADGHPSLPWRLCAFAFNPVATTGQMLNAIRPPQTAFGHQLGLCWGARPSQLPFSPSRRFP